MSVVRLPIVPEAPDNIMDTSTYNPLDGESDSEGQPLVSDLEKKRKVLRTRAVQWLKVAGRWSWDNLLLILTALSVVVGVILGLSVHQAQPSRVAVELIAFPGELFLRMLKMLILPLIVFSLMAGLGSLNAKVAGSLGWRTVLYYLSTTMLAIVLGLILVLSIQPGGRSEVSKLKPCDNSSISISGHGLDTLDAMLDLLR